MHPTPAMNGAVYSARVTNIWGNAVSGNATLTVLQNPRVLSASSRGNCHAIYVKFNKPVNLNGIYTVTPGIIVGATTYGENHSVVCLAVSPDLTPDAPTYPVTVTGATSETDGLVVDPLFNSAT